MKIKYCIMLLTSTLLLSVQPAYSLAAPTAYISENTNKRTVATTEDTNKENEEQDTQTEGNEPVQDEGTQEPTEPLEIKIGVDVMRVSETIPYEAVIDRYQLENYDYNGQSIKVLRGTDSGLILSWITDRNKKGGSLYIYDEKGKFYPYIKVASAKENYLILKEPAEGVAIPDGYESTVLQFDGKPFGIWRSNQENALTKVSGSAIDLNDFYLVYGLNQSGTEGFYNYDALEKTFQRYISKTPVLNEKGQTPEEAEASLKKELSDLREQNSQQKSKATLFICGFIIGCFLLLILIINLLLRNKDLKEEIRELESDDPEDESELKDGEEAVQDNGDEDDEEDNENFENDDEDFEDEDEDEDNQKDDFNLEFVDLNINEDIKKND